MVSSKNKVLKVRETTKCMQHRHPKRIPNHSNHSNHRNNHYKIHLRLNVEKYPENDKTWCQQLRFGPFFGPKCSPSAANGTPFAPWRSEPACGWPKVRSIWYFRDKYVWLNWVTCGTYVDQLWPNANRPRLAFTLFSKSFPRTHKHTNPQAGSAGEQSALNYVSKRTNNCAHIYV